MMYELAGSGQKSSQGSLPPFRQMARRSQALLLRTPAGFGNWTIKSSHLLMSPARSQAGNVHAHCHGEAKKWKAREAIHALTRATLPVTISEGCACSSAPT